MERDEIFRNERIAMNARDLAIVEMRLIEGSSLKTIGEKYKISPERIRKIIERFHEGAQQYLAREQLIKERVGSEPYPYAFFSDLSTKSQALLKSRGIRELADLTRYSAAELLRFRGIGMKSFKEISALLRMNGLALKVPEREVKKWVMAEAQKTDPENEYVVLENPDAKQHINTLLLMRF